MTDITASHPSAATLPRRVLIANRGEIAVRIARTCRSLGIETVAVHSDVDGDALHVEACDQAVRLGGAAPADSYLRVDALLEAAARTGADAVHPGYGFLAENAGFATAVLEAGLTWIGPSPDAIATMGDKVAAKRAMADAGVPLVPGEELVDDVSDGDLTAAGERIGYPLLVKAAAGGGGKGMRIVRDTGELVDAVAAARREALGAFGDGTVFLERYLDRARHVEVQILGDHHGQVVHAFERECSVQRRHQKVVEEAPSPGIDGPVRDALLHAAVAAGRAIGYRNAGTVEFIVDESRLAARRDGQDVDPRDCIAFLEVNTRLQVEHPVTEETVRIRDAAGQLTRLDLVREQLHVAAGLPLRFAQDQLVQTGHAIEVRLYAEEPAAGYLPRSGPLHALLPAHGDGVRWDLGVRSGDVIATHYDPMIAKVIAAAPTRTEAAARLARELDTTVLAGVTTNRDLLVAVLRDPTFLSGATTTDHLDVHHPGGTTPAPSQAARRVALAAVAVAGTVRRAVDRPDDLPAVRPGFASAATFRPHLTATVEGEDVTVRHHVTRDGHVALTILPGATPEDRDEGAALDLMVRLHHHASGAPLPAGEDLHLVVEVDGVRSPLRVTTVEDVHVVATPHGRVTVREHPRFPDAADDVPTGATLAPMPGSVVSVDVAEGDRVDFHQLLCAVEAMKMEHRVTAPVAGTVVDVRVTPGQQVDADQVLIVVEPDAEGDVEPDAEGDVRPEVEAADG